MQWALSVQGWVVWLKIIGAIKVLDQPGRFIPVIWNKGVSQGQWVICISTCNYHSSLSLFLSLHRPYSSFYLSRPFPRTNKVLPFIEITRPRLVTADDRQSSVQQLTLIVLTDGEIQWRQKYGIFGFGIIQPDNFCHNIRYYIILICSTTRTP